MYDVGFAGRSVDFVYGAIVIMGGGQLLLFDDGVNTATTQYLQTNYIFIEDGTFQIGTETQPHCQKLEIVLHGGKYDQEIPIYGNKMIALRNGNLLMHGCKVEVPWTWLWSTASAGDNTVITKVQVNDWKKGMWVGLTSTDFNYDHTDFVQLAADATTETVDGALRGKLTLAQSL